MQTEVTSEFHFYESPKFTERTNGPFYPWRQYELREEQTVEGEIISTQRIAYLNGDDVEWMIKLGSRINDKRTIEKGVVSIRDMVDWVNGQEIE